MFPPAVDAVEVLGVLYTLIGFVLKLTLTEERINKYLERIRRVLISGFEPDNFWEKLVGQL